MGRCMKSLNASQRKRVTIRDVAIDAEVSFAAVSKVLRGAYGVSDALRARVNESIEKLGYSPNLAARAMRGRTYVVGVIFPDMRNSFFADIMSGINKGLERSPYQSVQAFHSNASEADLVRSMLDMRLDGAILVGSDATQESVELLARDMPLVTIGQHCPDAVGFDTVNNADRTSAHLALQHLYDQGARNISMISFDVPNGTVIVEREAGFVEKARELGVAFRIFKSGSTSREIHRSCRTMLDEFSATDAVFCWTDFVALEVLSFMHAHLLAVPNQLKVVGHDNIVSCDLSQNSLTSVDQAGSNLGAQAVRLLIERIEGRVDSVNIVTNPTLVARRSTGALP